MRRKKERKVKDEKKRKKSMRKREKQRKEKKSIRGLYITRRGLKGSWKKENMVGRNSQNKTRIYDSSEHVMKGNGRRGNN